VPAGTPVSVKVPPGSIVVEVPVPTTVTVSALLRRSRRP
jgi:hypothetical protein